VLMLDDPKLDSTASHSSSSSHSLPRCVVCHPGHPAPVAWFYGFSAPASFTSTFVIRWSAVSFGFGYGYGRK